MSIVRTFGIAAFFAALLFAVPAYAAEPLLLQSPTVSATQIAFVYGGDIWTVPRSGGRAVRIVTGYGIAGSPRFSPDGSTVAFSADYDGNVNVYTVPAIGGEPRRLTWHPGSDIVIGWTPDGSKILFVSGRNSPNDSMQPYEVSRDGGIPVELPLPDITDGSFSPDGTHLAYVPNNQWEPYWQHYRGGQITPIWIANMADSSVVSIAQDNSNNRFPMWIGDEVYFVSDRSGHYALYSYNTRTRAVETRVPNPSGFDIVAASSGDGVIVYSKFDSIHLYDPATHSDRAVPIAIAAEMPEVRPHFVGVAGDIQNYNISPSGVRAVFEAHGDIITVPADNGSVRNITQTPSVEERDPSWSPNGRWIAYFSDASGEYTLRLRDQRGLDPERVFKLEPYPSFYYSPTWSPDSKKIAYNDKHGGLYYIDISESNPHAVKVADQPYETFDPNTFEQTWSPDSRYIGYIKQLPNFLHAVDVYDTQDHVARQITDGMANVISPAFDPSGKFLYFLASTDTGFSAYGLDMESDQRPSAYSVYAVTLHKSEASPVAPETGDEPVKGDDEGTARAKPQPTHAPSGAKPEAQPQPPAIDFDDIDQRVVALPIPEANYDKLQTAGPGTIFIEAAPLTSVSELPEGEALLRFDLASRKIVPFADDLRDFDVSADGKKMLLVRGLFQLSFAIVPTVQPVPEGAGTLATAGLQVWSVPKEEWAQMYHETWRMERDWFYDPHYHGLNLAAAEKVFSAFLPGLASRSDFTYLTREMIGYLQVGHLFASGPPASIPNRVTTGMLGADYTVDHDRFKFARIYSGENWNPQLNAPLTQPGVNVHVGDYLLAVNGKQIRADREVSAYFEDTAGQQTIITVGPNADGTGSRNVVVVPLASEAALRNLAWIADNRRTVDRLSGGKIGYIYMPDTGYGGFTNFNRYFFSQVNKEGIIIDERYNHGGQLADYVIDVLSRKARAIIVGRDGKPYTDPPLAINGPKVMLINEYAGSGGDAMPWLFRKAGLGPLVGVRTWGGLVGIGGYPSLMDGGSVTAPRVAIGGLTGHWEVEGHGISPDIEVVQDPRLVREGHDPQLEAGVAEAMKLLREHPVPHYEPPPYPNHHPVLPAEPTP